MDFFTIVLFCLAIQADTFIVSFAYGSSKIKIPILTAILINSISCFILLSSLIFAEVIETLTSPIILKYVSCAMLFIIGAIKLYTEYISKNIKNKQLQFENKYAKLDTNNDKILSLKESVSLSVALSLDGFFAGISFGIFFESIIIIICLCFLIGFAAILLGIFFGNKLSKRTPIDFSFLSGLLLIVIAISRL